jgi:hypothetical protein
MKSWNEFLAESSVLTIKGPDFNGLVKMLKKHEFVLDSTDADNIERRPKYMNGSQVTLFKDHESYNGTLVLGVDRSLEIKNIKRGKAPNSED